MYKTAKIVLVLSLSVGLLAACSEKKEEKETDTTKTTPVSSFQGVDFDKIYNMSDKEALVKIGDTELTVGELKKITFEQSLLTTINSVIDQHLLIQKYTVTKEELDAEIARQKEVLGESSLNKESIQYQLAYNKAVEDLVDYTEEDLKNIYKQYYEGKDTRSYEEMKEDIEKQAPYILGGQKVYEYQKELRKEAKVEFNEESLKEQFNLSIAPEVMPEERKSEEKPSN